MDVTTRRHRSETALTVTAEPTVQPDAVGRWQLHQSGSNGAGSAERARPAIDGAVVDLVPALDRAIRHADLQRGSFRAADAVERALRDVRREPIGVVGPHAAAIAERLRQRGHEADALQAPGTRAARGTRRDRHAKRPVLVAVDCIEHAASPGELLAALKAMLPSEGRLIAVVPNMMHAAVRLAVLLGRYPLAPAESALARHAFTAADAERHLNDAGFTVVGVERQVDSIDVLNEIGRLLPEGVIDLLADDAEAMASHFAFVAEPDGSAAAPRLIHRRLRQLADEQRTAVADAARLGDRVAELELRVRHWAAETDALAGPGMPTLETVARVETRVQELTAGQDDVAAAADRARTAVERLDAQVRAMADQVRAAREREAERDAALRQARERLLGHADEIARLRGRLERTRYRRLIRRLREIVGRAIPRHAAVAVISRGDDELVAFEGRRGWHFPQAETGVYAGHHPADSAAAIAHVEALRARGMQYLVIPRTAFWWLDHYREFHQYLLRRGRCVLRDERTCAVFALGGRGRSR